MAVVATAGHVDHGKSTLVRALTGIEPDRWAHERQRGLTIDLGFAWMELPSGREVSFVDVPGHERFVANMLAGLGPAPVVCFVVAADEGWAAQSADHRDAIEALSIDTGVVVLTKTDLAPHRVPEVREQVRSELSGTGLARAPIIPVSAATGAGLPEFVEVLDEILRKEPAPATGPVRMWVDRSFAVAGAGTVITGTLAHGRVAPADVMELSTPHGRHRITVRSLQTHQQRVTEIAPVSRAAVNVRGIASQDVSRGDALLTPGAWWHSETIDVRRASGTGLDQMSRTVSVHVGTAAVTARIRPFDAEHARLQLRRPLPLRVGDRAVLRDSTPALVAGGVIVLDVDPPALTRRGAGRRRARTLARMGPGQDAEHLSIEVTRRGGAQVSMLSRMGLRVPEEMPAPLRRYGDWVLDDDAVQRWAERLKAVVEEHVRTDPLSQGLTDGAAVDALDLTDPALLSAVVEASEMRQVAGRILPAAARTDLGSAESAVRDLEQRLREHPFQAPEASELAQLDLRGKELAAAERQGRLLRLTDTVVLLPSAPAQAMVVLAALEQPFTTSSARQALGTTRRTAVPLLEHLDTRGWTRSIAPGKRIVVR
ncbi:MAG TPA: selenocysteine-specific translation elongation factor [Beutenbergiaceae bacterium]|nr:selenocysteine-specific translation elongation factor [Beutenbergiaceae bacterium]